MVEGFCPALYADVEAIRHGVVARIVDAYDKAALKAVRARETRE